MRGTLFLTALLCLFSSACGNNPFEKKKKSKNSAEYFVHGDPMQMIAGSTQNKTSFLSLDDLQKFNGFHAANAVAFIQQEPKEVPTTFSQVEDDNSTDASQDEIDKIFELVPYAFVKIDDTHYEYQPTINPERNYALQFTASNGLLELATVDHLPVEVLHYSLKVDGAAMSFLVRFTDSSAGTVLLSMAFADSQKVQDASRSEDGFSYLVDTVQLGWQEPIKLQACGDFTENQKLTLATSASSWLSDPKKEGQEETGFVPVQFEMLSEFPPFSDLNVHCVNLVSSFRLEASDQYYTAGVTLPTINSASKGIVDSDVFLFLDHYPVARQFNGGASVILMHELGHFFGLGHEFRTTMFGEPLHPSIMAYSLATPYISEWDYSAVHALYGGYLTAGTGS